MSQTKLMQAFDVRSVRPADPDGNGGFPVGAIPSVITKAEFVENKDADSGHQAVLTLTCVDGPSRGLTATWRLNLYHKKSQKAVEIAYQQLAALGHVTGVFNVDDLSQLYNKPFLAISESRNDPQYPNATEIKGVLDFNGDKPGQPGIKGRIPVAQTAAPAAAAPSQPWTPGSAAAPATGPAFGPASAAPAATPAAPGFAPAAPAQPPAAAPAAPAVASGGWNTAAAPAAPAAGGAPAWATRTA